MRIVQCIATKGNLFNNTLIEFDSGVNVVSGASDSGKTLLLNSLCETIWGSAGKKNHPEELWDNFLLNCVVQLGGEDYRIIREKESFAITRLSTDQTLKEKDSSVFFARYMKEFPAFYRASCGVGSDLFFNTCYCQSPVEEHCYPDDFAALRPLLMSDSSFLFEKYKQIENFFSPDNIDNQLLVYTGRIKKELRESERELEIRQIRQAKFSKMKNEADVLADEIAAFETERKVLEAKRSAVAELEIRKQKIQEHLDENQTLSAMLQEEKDKRGQVKSIQKVLKNSYPRFLKIKEDSKLLAAIEKKFSSIQYLLKEKLALEEHLIHSRKVNTLRAVVLVLISVLFFIGGYFVLPFFNMQLQQNLLTGIPVLLIFLSLSASVAVHLSHGKKYSTEQIELELQEKYSSIQELLAKTDIGTEGMESDELYELILQFFLEFNLYSEQKDELESVSDSIDPGNEASIQEQLKQNNNAVLLLEKEFSDICSKNGIDSTAPLEFNSSGVNAHIDQQIETINTEIRKVNVLKQEMLNEIARFADAGNGDDALTQSYENKKAEYDSLELKIKTVRILNNIMKECVEKREQSFFDSFSEEGYKMFSELSGGKTSLDSLDMYRKVLTRPLDQVFPKPSLRQIFLLTMKFALTDYISVGEESLPLILDEPCVYMDKKKIEIVLNYVELLAPKRQIIILTHDQQTYRGIGRQIEIS